MRLQLVLNVHSVINGTQGPFVLTRFQWDYTWLWIVNCIRNFIWDVITQPSLTSTANWLISVSLQWRHNGCKGASTVYWGADQRNHQSSVSLAFVRGIHRRPVNSPHKWPVTRKMLPFDDVIMLQKRSQVCWVLFCLSDKTLSKALQRMAA